METPSEFPVPPHEATGNPVRQEVPPPADDTPPELAGSPAFSGLVNVFFSPGALFEQLRARPTWIVALLVGAAMTVLASALIPTELYLEAFRSAGSELPGGEGMGAAMKWAGVGFGAVGYFIMAFVIAGLLTVVFGFILGDDARYKQYLAVTSYAMLITAVGYLLVTPLRIMQGDIQLSFNAGTFLPFIEEGYAARFLRGLELFTLWSWVVMGLGVSVLSRERSWGSAASVILIIGVGITALFALIPGR